MLDLGIRKANTISYRKSSERFKIISQELAKGNIVEYDNQNVYSFPRKAKKSKHIKFKSHQSGGANKTLENFKCNSCSTKFRIVGLEDIEWVVCIRCGGINIDELTRREEYEFENKIK